MNWATLGRSKEDWWSSGRADGWATCAVVGLLLGFYAVRLFLRLWLHSFRQEKSLIVSASRSSGHCMDTGSDGAFHVGESDLQKLLFLLDESGHSRGLPWTLVVDKHSETLSYHAKLREPEDGTPTEYLSTSLFCNCSCKCLKDFYMDSDYRLRWDKTFESYELLQRDERTSFEIGRFVRKYPFVRPREYVLAWRLWQGEDGSFYYVAKQCEHPQAPQVAMYTRVQHYMSGWRIQQEGDHCRITMWHQEDTTPTAKMAFSYRIWSYMCDTEKSLRRYKCEQPGVSQSTSPQIPKVPASLLKALPEVFKPSTQSNANATNTGGMKRREIAMRKSGKLMASSMLLVGAAMFFTQRSAPLGAKIAAFYAIQKLVKPSTTSARPMRQHYPVL